MLPETQSKRTFVFRKYYEKYKHLWILLYFFVYMAWFNYCLLYTSDAADE